MTPVERFQRINHTITFASGTSIMRPAVLDTATGLVARFYEPEYADAAAAELEEHPARVVEFGWRPQHDNDNTNGRH